MFYIAVLLLIGLQSIQSKEVCYDDLGCFKDTYPFGYTLLRPIGKLPQDPAKINTTFKLFNKNYKTGAYFDVDNLPRRYLSSTSTKVIIHGFGNSENSPWVIDMKNALLEVENCNVIVVDWKDGSTLPYETAVANTRVVGAVTARLLNKLISQKMIKSSDIHLIGFSLGAHTAGYVGERVSNIARITGLDPAGPYFESTPKNVRLDPSDAVFVDVIHTNAMVILKEVGFGISTKSGHVDYFPNGGKTQPGCLATNLQIWDSLNSLLQSFDFDGAANGLGCSHGKSHEYFIKSIRNSCQFTSYPCKSIKEFNEGKCLSCSNSGCNRMGYYASPNKETGSLYLTTSEEESKCEQIYSFKLTSQSKFLKRAKGTFSIYLTDGNENSSTEILDDNETTFESKSVIEKFVSFEKPIDGEIDKLYIRYGKGSGSYEYTWKFREVEVYSGETQTRIKFCPESSFIPKITTEYNRC